MPTGIIQRKPNLACSTSPINSILKHLIGKQQLDTPFPPGTWGNKLPQCNCVGRPTVPQEERSDLGSTLAGTGRKRRLEIFPTGGRGEWIVTMDQEDGS